MAKGGAGAKPKSAPPEPTAAKSTKPSAGSDVAGAGFAGPTVGPMGTIAAQVFMATLDPGYRRVAQLLDEWDSGCTCVGGSIPPAQVDAYTNALLTQSLDPALKILAPALGALMGNCCNAVASPVPGEVNAMIKLLTLDTGAARLGSCIDAMHATCCDND